MRRRMLWAGMLVCIVLICFVLLHRAAEVPNHIDHSTFEKIDKGMTRADVLGLLGVRPGDYVTKNVHFVRPVNRTLIEDSLLPEREDEIEEVWTGNGGRITIWFGADCRVTRRIYLPAAFEPSFLDKVRSWVSL